MSELHIDSVSHSYSGKTILSDVFVSCKVGEVKGLLGRNGSGKSTLFKIIFGTIKPTSKYVSINGKIIKNISDGRNLINYLPQDNFLPNNIKVSTLINLFLPVDARCFLLDNHHIQPLLERKNQHLSGGEKRILEILLLIHSKAKFILLDEPFNGLSPVLREYVIEYIRKAKAKKGFVISDHDYRNVIKVSDSILFLNNGHLREIQNNEELVKHGYLTDYNMEGL